MEVAQGQPIGCPECGLNTIYQEILSRAGRPVYLEESVREGRIVLCVNFKYDEPEEVRYVCTNCGYDFGTETDFLNWIKNLRDK